MTDDPGSGDPASRQAEEAVTKTRAESSRPRLPKRVGQFHIKDVLASGGMGVVYRAVQEQPRRTVAVKVMRHGVASRSAMRRFEYESQVLARLRHPGIAHVFEAGTHDDGAGAVPYFAMEYIPNAKPITQFAREKSLGTRECLKLFASVCDAVHHGHQKGIIHRDLKPDNILVDPQGEVKIIDFGVARGTDSDLAVTTLQTDIGQLVGTLQYMSPEQCEADPDAIDARSDVYALGVVLYELVSGQLPYTVSRKHIFDGTQVIREHAPAKLSSINRTLRGDVETIVLTALEKDRDRRYQTAADFAQDIRRYLCGDAINARPPSTVYRMRVFTRRHRLRLEVAALVALVAAFAAIQIVRSHGKVQRAEDLVAAAMKRATEAEKAAAASQVVGAPTDEEAEDLVGHVPEAFSLSTIDGQRVGSAEFSNHKATVLNFVALDCPFCLMQIPKVENIRAEYQAQSVRFVNVLQTMRKDYPSREASELLTRLGSHIELAMDEGNKTGRRFSVTSWPCLFILNSDGVVRHVSRGNKKDLMARLRGQLDSVLHGVATPEEKLAEAEKLHRQTLKNNRQTLGEGHRDTLRSMENLAVTLSEQDKHDEAEELYREIWHIRERFLGENDPETLESMHNLAVIVHEQDKPAEAETLHRKVLDGRRRVLGEDHTATRLSMAHLGLALRAQGKTEGAGPYIAELIELRRRAARERDASATALNEYAWLLLTCEPVELRDAEAALPAAQEAVRLSGRHEPGALDTLALAQKMTGDLEAAIETQKEAIALLSLSDFMTRTKFEQTLSEYYREAGDLGALEEWYRDKLARARASTPPGSLAVAVSLDMLGQFLLEQKRYAEAEPVLREVLDIARAALPKHHWRISQAESTVSVALAGQGRFEEAEPLIVAAYNHMKHNPQVPADDVRRALENVVFLYTAWQKPDEAAKYRAMIASKAAVTNPSP